MRLLLGFLTIALLSSTGNATITADQEYILNHLGYGSQKATLGTLVHRTKNLLIAKYNYSTLGGSTTSDIKLRTDFTSTASGQNLAALPAKAIITNVFLNILTKPTGVSGATIRINSEAAGDLFSATAVTALGGAFYQATPNGGSTTTYVKTTASRNVTMTVGSQSALTAGKFDVIIEYVLGD